MTDQATIVALQARYGGTIVSKPPEQEHYKPQWRWRVQDRGARKVIERLMPYLRVKRDDAIRLANHFTERGLK